MKRLFYFFFIFITISVFSVEIPTPESYFGFKPGADRSLFTYEQLTEYLMKLDKVSDRLHMVEVGKSPMGKPMYLLFVSDENNIFRLDELKEINKQLAINPYLEANKKKEMIENGKVFFLFTLSMHSTEVGPSQTLPQFAYEIATTEDPEIMSQLSNVVLMFFPCHNPDGMDMVVNHYNKYKGTKYEGSSMPGVYHKYVGHDNNRDFISLTQSDTKVINRVISTEWFPQVMCEKHQMGSTGPRYFVPPNHDPIAENIDENMWSWLQTFGTNAARNMTKKGLKGVAHNWMFDNYWPGSTETCLWKNVISWLTECASVKGATPIFVEKNELSARGKGLSEYKISSNMPALWEGGWWKLSDIVNYELASLYSSLKTSSEHKVEILQFRNDICVKNVKKGNNEPPYFYILPENQNDFSELAHLISILNMHGINVYKLKTDVFNKNKIYKKGSVVIPLSQSYRPFIKEVMEKQTFPVRHYTPNGEIIRPYDITSWSLPLHYGLTCYEIKEKLNITENSLEKIEHITFNSELSKNAKGYILSVKENASFAAAFNLLSTKKPVSRLISDIKINGESIEKGSFFVNSKNINEDFLKKFENIHLIPVFDSSKLKLSSVNFKRIALVETIFHDMDSGWTRYIFDSYNIPYDVLTPDKLQKANLSKYNAIVFPDNSKSILLKGKYKSGGNYYTPSYPPSFIKGMGEKGFNKIMNFMDNGGKLIAWRGSTELFSGPLKIIKTKKIKKKEVKEVEEFTLPFRDISKSLRSKKLYVPGSFLKLVLIKENPLTYGLPETIGVFSRGVPAFRTSLPNFDMDRRVVGYFPENNILLSGYAENEKLLSNKPAIIWMKKGKGQFVLFSFNPQFRASTPVTYKLLFNSILLNSLN